MIEETWPPRLRGPDRGPRNAPETETGFALDELLAKEGTSLSGPGGSDLAKGFRTFRKKRRKHWDAELIRAHGAASGHFRPGPWQVVRRGGRDQPAVRLDAL